MTLGSKPTVYNLGRIAQRLSTCAFGQFARRCVRNALVSTRDYTDSGEFLKELTALKGVGTDTDSVLAADTSTFLPLTTAPDGLAALLNAIYSQE